MIRALAPVHRYHERFVIIVEFLNIKDVIVDLRHPT